MKKISFFAMRTLVLIKLKIFFKDYAYSIIAPIVSSLLFIIILKTISDYYQIEYNNIDYMNFIIPGIIAMIVIQETYSNISETIITMKQYGTFKDIIMSPISRIEIAISYLIVVSFIGILIACINLIIINFFLDIQYSNLFRFIYYLFLISVFFTSVGAIVGFISYTWDVQQGIFNFIIAPISLLSGTFFSIESIPDDFKNYFLMNPFYYLISNFKKSFNDNQIYNLNIDITIVILIFIIVYLNLFIFKKGIRVVE